MRNFEVRPTKKRMRARLKVKISRWKSGCLKRTKQKRNLKAQLERSQQRVALLESQLTELKMITEPQAVPNHFYPAQMITLAVFIVVQAGGSLRCAAKTIAFLAQMMGWSYGQPSHLTVRNWVLRCGLYGLNYAKAKSGRYVVIIDESIQIGREKLLLMLGVKLSEDRSLAAPITMADTEVLGLEVQQSWRGEQVADFIKSRLTYHQGIQVAYVISDRGTALLAALRKLGLSIVGDCSHLMMNAVKKLFSNHEALSELASRIGQLRRQLMLTDQGYLLPPTLRDKDRFLRIFTIVDWVERIETYWEKLPPASRDALDFLKQARPLVKRLRQVRALIALTAKLLKSAGLSQRSSQLWEQRITRYKADNPLTPQAEAFIATIRSYFQAHTELIAHHGRLLCCSDIIESTFGRYKNKGGMQVISADVLSIALYPCKLTPSFVREALTKVSQKHVEEWQARYTCQNRLSVLRRMDRELKSVA